MFLSLLPNDVHVQLRSCIDTCVVHSRFVFRNLLVGGEPHKRHSVCVAIGKAITIYVNVLDPSSYPGIRRCISFYFGIFIGSGAARSAAPLVWICYPVSEGAD